MGGRRLQGGELQREETVLGQIEGYRVILAPPERDLFGPDLDFKIEPPPKKGIG
jgi:hypothetical protein